MERADSAYCWLGVLFTILPGSSLSKIGSARRRSLNLGMTCERGAFDLDVGAKPPAFAAVAVMLGIDQDGEILHEPHP